MFNNKAKLIEKRRYKYNIITTQNKSKEIFCSFFENFEKRDKIYN